MTQDEISHKITNIVMGLRASMDLLDGNMAQAYSLMGVTYAKLTDLDEKLKGK